MAKEAPDFPLQTLREAQEAAIGSGRGSVVITHPHTGISRIVTQSEVIPNPNFEATYTANMSATAREDWFSARQPHYEPGEDNLDAHRGK